MLTFFVEDPDPGSDAFLPRIRMEKFRIWDKNPGSARMAVKDWLFQPPSLVSKIK
jgi:hypothetical protein